MASTNITTFPGKVGISNVNPTHTLAIGSNVYVDDTADIKLTVLGGISATGTLSGDGAGLSNIQTSNVIGLSSNISRIDDLTNDLSDNSSRITTVANDLSDNSSRITTVASDLSDNSSRITTVANDLSDNSSRITTVASDLSDNSSRIATLESGDVSITGKKTFTEQVTFESNIHVNGDLLVANTVNMVVSDPIIELGSNNLNTGDLGIVMTRHGASNSNVAVFYDESADVLKMGYTLGGANDTTIELDSNALAVSIQGNLEVGTGNLFVDTTTSNVGIGTTTPAYTLDVVGDINLSGDFYQGGSPFVSSLWTDGTNSLYYRSNVEVGTANLFVDTTTSNVGIGTTTPAYTLDVVGDINLSGDFYQGGSPFVSSLWTSSGTDLYYNSGSVGISNTAPDHDLSVGSNLYVHDTGSNVLVVDGNISVSNTITTQRLTLNNVSISTTMNLQQVTDVGNVTSNTVQFTNPTTAFVTTANVEVGGELTVTGNVGVSQDLTVSGNIYGPMTTFRAYSFKTSYSTSWTSAEGLAGTEKTILTQNVTVPDTYTSVSPCTMRVFYMWKWVGESDRFDDANTTNNSAQELGWRTSVTHNATTYDMNTGNFGATSSGFYVVSSSAIGYHLDEASTMDLAMVEGNFEINGVSAGDTLAIDLNVVATNDFWGTIYTNRTVTDSDNDARERGTTSLVVWLEPIL